MLKSLKFVMLLLLIVFSSATISAQKVKTQNAKATTKNEIFYVDVRTPAEFAQGSVKGAVNIPLDQVEKQLSKFKGKKNIVVFCRSGSRSSQAKAILEQNSITNVTNGGSWEDVTRGAAELSEAKAKLKK